MKTADAPATGNRVVSHSEWIEARKALLEKEKAHTSASDELARARRELPWVKVEKQYVFDTPGGRRSLADLFERRSQLYVYHFMLAPGWEHGCPSCSYLCDHVEGMLPHLHARDVSFAAISRAPLSEITAFKQRMGWKFPWASSAGNTFNFDYNVSFTPDEMASGAEYNYRTGPIPISDLPGASVFYKDASGQVFHTYSTYARGLEAMVGTYHLLDLMPKGRDEDGYAFSMAWVRHHDRYDQNYSVDATAGYIVPKTVGGGCCCSKG